jgi:hypothetical protein
MDVTIPSVALDGLKVARQSHQKQAKAKHQQSWRLDIGKERQLRGEAKTAYKACGDR